MHQKERISVSHLPGQLALARVPQPEHRCHVEVIPYRDIEPQRVVPEDSELPREFAFGSEEEEFKISRVRCRKEGQKGGLSDSHVCAVAGSGVCGLAGMVVLQVPKPVIANVEVRICSPSHVADEHFGL